MRQLNKLGVYFLPIVMSVFMSGCMLDVVDDMTGHIMSSAIEANNQYNKNLEEIMSECLKSTKTTEQACKYMDGRLKKDRPPTQQIIHIYECMQKKDKYDRPTFDYCYDFIMDTKTAPTGAQKENTRSEKAIKPGSDSKNIKK